MANIFNYQLRQVILLAIIILLGILLFSTLLVFLACILGGITVYILTREWYSKIASEKVKENLYEMKEDTLISGSGQKVTSPKKAIAIGLSEARKEGAKVPRKKTYI